MNSRVLTHVILTAAPGGGNYYYSHFTDEGTEAQQLTQYQLRGRGWTGKGTQAACSQVSALNW